MDQTVFQFINGLAGRWIWLDRIWIFCATYLEYILIGGVVVLALWPVQHIQHFKKTGRVALLAMLGSYVVFKIGLPFLLLRPRPFIIFADAVRLINTNSLEHFRSFPSGHAVSSFALAMVVWLYDKPLGRWFLAGAILVSIGRVFVGVHWPSDILAGAAFGIFGAYVTKQRVTRYSGFWDRFLS
ncbi:MAG: phosphatase PAP2 family protein [Patescibacteria group bacterium]